MSPLIVVLLITIAQATHALTCYENDKEGNVFEVTNDAFNYCALIPESANSEGRLFGIGEKEDHLAPYDSSFQQSDAIYKVLSVCLYEKYDLSKLSPRLATRPEFLFRCVCNYDRCNSQKTFQAYLSKVQRDNE